jgi:hypothetical protein
MFPIWLILGSLVILSGVFNKKLLQLLGFRPLSEVFTTPSIKQSSKAIERVGRWLVIALGISFLVQGLGTALPAQLSSLLSALLLGISVLLLLVMFGIAIVNWKTR